MSDIVVKKSNELIDPQAQMLVGFLKDMGLPYDNIIADQAERKTIGDNLDSLIRDLPDEIKKNARYISKFVIGSGFGLLPRARGHFTEPIRSRRHHHWVDTCGLQL